VLFHQIYADIVKAKQSTAEYGRRLCLFRPSNKLTLKVVSESRVTWATCVPILVFLGLSVLELGPMYATYRRQTDVSQKHCLMSPPYGGGGIISGKNYRHTNSPDSNFFEHKTTTSLGSLNRNCSWHVLMISGLFVLNIL